VDIASQVCFFGIKLSHIIYAFLISGMSNQMCDSGPCFQQLSSAPKGRIASKNAPNTVSRYDTTLHFEVMSII
jgi:hypothetical protein